jgi:hypothetical protein
MDPHVVVVANVWGGTDRLDPVRISLPGHRDGVIEIPGAIVNAREDVTVEVDHCAGG